MVTRERRRKTQPKTRTLLPFVQIDMCNELHPGITGHWPDASPSQPVERPRVRAEARTEFLVAELDITSGMIAE
jgi:hypothetical protein